jgi:hypothetical protein
MPNNIVAKHTITPLLQAMGLLSSGSEPTKAYWLKGMLAHLQHGQQGWIELNPRKRPLPSELEILDTIVVVRTLPTRWLRALRQMRVSGKRVILLLDDALLDTAALAELRWNYRWRLWWTLGRHRQGLSMLVSELWVSTEALAKSCRLHLGSQTMIIRVMPLRPPLLLIQQPRVYRLAYLGTASHRAELAWLLPLLAELQHQRSDCLLELILDRRWRHKFRNLPRTRIFYPMDWGTYLLDTGNRSVELLLVPLMAGAFNSGRAPVKFFDAARLGAVGLYSNRPPYKNFIRDGKDGLLLPDDPQAWIAAITALLQDPIRHKDLASSCRERALDLCSDL